jgi:hypothetical protein
MGQDWRANQVMSLPLLLAARMWVKHKIKDADVSPKEYYNQWIVFHT